MSSKCFESKQCIACQKTGGVLTCDGCKQVFCYKHVIEHRQQLTYELETLMQEHDCIQQDIALQKECHPAFEEINQWEKKAIEKIQMIAEKVREELRESLESSNERFMKKCREIADVLRSARDAENFSENELKRWTEQLNELRLQMKVQFTLEVPQEDNDDTLHFIHLKQENTSEQTSVVSPEVFSEVNGTAIIEDDGLRITHNDQDLRYVYSRGSEIYSTGRHKIQFKVEQCSGSGNLFIGIGPSTIGIRQIMYQLTAVVGWFSNYQVWQNDLRAENLNLQEYNNEDIKTDDVFELIIDCEKNQIELFCERINRREMLNINLDRTPLPWCVLLGLRRKNDCVRILR